MVRVMFSFNFFSNRPPVKADYSNGETTDDEEDEDTVYECPGLAPVSKVCCFIETRGTSNDWDFEKDFICLSFVVRSHFVQINCSASLSEYVARFLYVALRFPSSSLSSCHIYVIS